MLACPEIPTVPKKSWIKQATDGVRSFLGMPANIHKNFQKSLSVYLELYKQLLIDGHSVVDHSSFNVTRIVSDIQFILYSLHDCKIIRKDYEKPFYLSYDKNSLKKVRTMSYIQ